MGGPARKKWFLGMRQKDESYHLNTDSLSHLTEYQPKQGSREKDVLRILRREGTLDTVKDNILDNSVDGSYVNLAEFIGSKSRNHHDKTHDVLIKCVLQFIAQEPNIKPRKFTKTDRVVVIFPTDHLYIRWSCILYIQSDPYLVTSSGERVLGTKSGWALNRGDPYLAHKNLFYAQNAIITSKSYCMSCLISGFETNRYVKPCRIGQDMQ
eukprot:sb/3470264/